MSNRIEKPIRSPEKLIAMLRDSKGISFNYIEEREAAAYLSSRNNYLRTASYRKNYEKHISGANEGKYIQLDFAYLVEMSKLDMYLRNYLLQMCIDIEHSLKVKVISDIEKNENEDGYSVVDDFLAENPNVLKGIAKKADSIFTGDLIEKYFDLCYVFDEDGIRTDILKIDCPVWVLVELMTFNELLLFLRFYSQRSSDRLNLNYNHLNTIRSLRNACAHNNCLLISLRPGHTCPTVKASQYVSRIPNIGKEERKNKLSCRPLFEIVCLLIEFNKCVSPSLRKNKMQELKSFAHGRLVKRWDYFEDNQVISTAICFLQKIIDNFA